MRRTLGIAAAIASIHLVCAAAAAAQVVDADASADTCPRNALKIYFASGDVNASPQAEALIGKIGETATSCGPDHLDLVAHFDSGVDGERAVSVALERLARVADDLVAQGISPDRIRVAARAVKAGEAATASLNQIDVLFRKADAEPAIEPEQSDIRTAPSEAI
jgi:outer membrane protein OmpA-like peptidoglycan-associated protein